MKIQVYVSNDTDPIDLMLLKLGMLETAISGALPR